MGKESIVKRVEALENPNSWDPRIHVAIKDTTMQPATYTVAGGKVLTQEQLDKWIKTFDWDDQLYIITLSLDKPLNELKVKVEDYRNLVDLLKEHDETSQKLEALKHAKTETA